VLFLMQAAAVGGIVATENLAITYALTLVFGFTIGNVYMMMSLLVGETFGMVSFGTVFGLVTMIGQVGSGAGPLLIGFIEDATGGYGVAFTVTAAATALSAVVVGMGVRPAR
jgi:nitrate/nitrite transporter NarK